MDCVHWLLRIRMSSCLRPVEYDSNEERLLNGNHVLVPSNLEHCF